MLSDSPNIMQSFTGPMVRHYTTKIVDSAAEMARLAVTLVDSGLLQQVLQGTLHPDQPPNDEEVGGVGWMEWGGNLHWKGAPFYQVPRLAHSGRESA